MRYGVQAGSKISRIDIRDIAAVEVKTLTKDGHEGKAYRLKGPVTLYSAYVLGSSRAW
jgi:uncharacterized protein YbjT (DUF2867 family)